MVKPPRIRHSKPRRDPVTIDLDPAEVKKSAAEGQTKESAAADELPKTPPSAPEKQAENPPRPAEAAKPAADRSGKPAAPTSQGGFGRQQPEASRGTPPTQSSSAGDPQNAGAGDAGGKKAAPQAPPASGARTASAPPPPRRGTALFAGVIGGLIALASAGALQFAGLFGPPPPPVASTSFDEAEVSVLRAELEELRQRIDAAPATSPEDPSAGIAALGERIDGLAAALEETRSLAERTGEAAGGAPDATALDTLEQRLAGLESALETLSTEAPGEDVADTVAGLSERLDTIEGQAAESLQAARGAASAAAEAGERIAALEQRLSGLSEAVEDQPRIALAVAATALKAAIERGGNFQAELDAFAAIAPEAPEIEALRPLAVAGVATRAEIAGGAPAAADAIVAAARPADPDASFVDRLFTSAQSLVTVRPIGAVEGEGAPAIAARMEAAIADGDYARAVAEYESLPEAIRPVAASYIERVKARLAAEQLIDQAISRALAPASGG